MSEQETRKLISKAAVAEKSDDALKFSQAACNTANAIRVLAENAILSPKA